MKHFRTFLNKSLGETIRNSSDNGLPAMHADDHTGELPKLGGKGGLQHLRGDPWRRQTRSELLNRMEKQQLSPPVFTHDNFASRQQPHQGNDLRWKEVFPIACLHAIHPSFVDSYVSAKLPVGKMWWAYQDSNLEPKHYECSALTVAAIGPFSISLLLLQPKLSLQFGFANFKTMQ